MNQFIIYPCFIKSTNGGIFVISYPDFPDLMLISEGFEEALVDSQEKFVNLILDESIKSFPTPTGYEEAKKKADEMGAYLHFVSLFNTSTSGQEVVKLTTTLPKWLRDEARKNNLSFSRILQDALIQVLFL